MIRRVATLAVAALALSVPAAASAAPTVAAVPTASTAAASATVHSVATARPKGSYAVKVLSVTDGDTIRVRVNGRSTPVRLIGLDAPEISPRQCYGTQATSRMKQLTRGGTVYIKTDGTQGSKDKYGRLLRHVYTAGGTSVALKMIEGGYAREYTYARKYAGQDSHRKAQSRAKAAKRGLWKSCVVAPKPKPKPKPKPVTSGCKIKGNISSSGEKIYHVPGGRSYNATVITASKGERWFCTEKQAVNAGWRKAKN